MTKQEKKFVDMTKAELLEELESAMLQIGEANKIITNLEQEKNNLASANSDNASKYVSVRDENIKLKKEKEELLLKIKNPELPDKTLLAELEKERQVSTEQIRKLHDFVRNLLSQQGNVHNSNVQLFGYIVNDIQSM